MEIAVIIFMILMIVGLAVLISDIEKFGEAITKNQGLIWERIGAIEKLIVEKNKREKRKDQ
ncbi:hypothetical protein ATZ36_06090 [Candidatus Endomicrobiellum trichonymphae]|jgi:predicted sugar kinase|uniref:Uncharacterized protein n=1 Tax=Endomicrobium trichonymphae TaxID=1408204 RepID=A0A1E5II91_ENDTX|nr:hypothetical protein ATZ36_06220 [Candidatus Endomicrobium trichonymphae]OEG70115.1 hypothetical protein ATZ36_06090 [Candidatus Endomicrobium trichonymphae]